jgi:hypothetical protein
VSQDLVIGFWPPKIERENHNTQRDSVRELPKGGPRNSTGVGPVMGVHWPWGGSLWVRVVMVTLVWGQGSWQSSSNPSKFIQA